MCDYSLEHVASRPARIADRLVSASFPHTLTGGFTASGDPNTAICLLPGTELVFDAPPRYRTGFFFGKKTAPSTMVRFRQINMMAPTTHHDALEFPDGTIVMLGDLFPKQWATVIQLPAAAHPDEAIPHRPAVVQKAEVLEPKIIQPKVMEPQLR